MSSFITFVSLLTASDFSAIFAAITENSKRDVIANRLRDSIRIRNNSLYCMDTESITWKINPRQASTSLPIVFDLFIDQSIETLLKTSTDEKRSFDILRNEFDREFEKARGGKLSKNMEFYLNALTVDDIFDQDIFGVHFLNGRFDLKSGTFRHLTEGGRTMEMGIASLLNYEWMPSSSEDTQLLVDQLKNLFRSEHELQYFLFYLGKCLSPTSTADCEFMIQFGLGGCGKSTLLNIIKTVFQDGVYAKSLNHNIFDNDAEFIRTIRGVPQSVRFILVEEIGKGKKAVSNIKKLCDGSIAIREKGLNTTIDFRVNGKLFVTSNNYLEFEGDTGIARRALYYKFKNRFAKVPEEIDPDNFVFGRNPFFSEDSIHKAWTSVHKCVFFNAIANFTAMHLGEQFISRPPTILSGLELPTWLTMLQTFFVSDPAERVLKSHVVQFAVEYFYPKIVSEKDVINGLREIGVTYEPSFQINNIRGCFVGIQFK
jgi:hypothetical protein